MKNRKYNIDKKPLSENEVEQYKDFDNLLNKFEAADGPIDDGGSMNAFSGIGKGLFALVGLAVVAWMAIKLLGKKEAELVDSKAAETSQTEQVEQTKVPQVSPPIAAKDIAYEEFTIDASKKEVITTQKGSKIIIKKNTFKTVDGEKVEGKVTVRFREFHDPFDIFLSGIPMDYDSLGGDYVFESAGMFELRAEKEGEKLSDDFNKDIEVELTATNQSPGYNNYYFDEAKGKWQYTGREEPIVEKEQLADLTIRPTRQEKSKKLEPKKVDLPAQAPVKPQEPKLPILRSDRYSFAIQVDTKKFPELSPKMTFQVDEDKSKFSPLYYEINWDEIVLERSSQPKRYIAHLKKDDKQFKVVCFPALSKAEHALEMKKYQEELKRYNEYWAKRQPVPKAKALSKEEQLIQNTVLNKTRRASFRVKRKFKVGKAGYWNCDTPRKIRVLGEQVLASFMKDGKRIPPKKVYNVLAKRNLLLNPLAGQMVNYSPKGVNVMWVLTEDNKVGIVSSEQFKEVRGKAHDFTLELHELDEGLELVKQRIKKG